MRAREGMSVYVETDLTGGEGDDGAAPRSLPCPSTSPLAAAFVSRWTEGESCRVT